MTRTHRLRIEGAVIEVNARDVVVHTDDLSTVLGPAEVGRLRMWLDEWVFNRMADRRRAEEAEVARLRRFHDDVVSARRTSQEQAKHPFFAGQRLRRLVREAIERFDR